MAENKNLKIWNDARQVPNAAKKEIIGGRLKGMTDINPVWRYQILTAMFGPVGFGWRYEVVDQRLEPGANGEVVAFVNLNLYVKVGDQWSEPIPGNGGSMFIANEKAGAKTSDEAFKMATTDALSVCCKLLGVGADVYWSAGANYGTKYDKPAETKAEAKPEVKAEKPETKTEPKPEVKPEAKEEPKPAPKPEVPADDDLPEVKTPNQKKAQAIDEARVKKAREVVAPDGRTLGQICDTNPEELRQIATANKADKNLAGACVVVYNAWAESKTS